MSNTEDPPHEGGSVSSGKTFAEPDRPTSMPDYLIRHASLRQLQVFEAIVRQGSFTRAAEELYLTQPTVSMQIKKLADTVGLPLFEHVGRGVRPTEAGLVMYEASRRIFENLANLEMKIADIKGIRRGRLRLGMITTAQYFAPQVIGDFCRRYPGIDVAVKVANRELINDRINANEDDLYIMGQAPREAMDIVAFPFAPNPLVVLAPGDHPLVGEKDITLKRLVREPFIMREPGSGIRGAVERLLDTRGLRADVRMELGGNEAIKHAIAAKLGISVLSLHALSLIGADGPVRILDVEGFPIVRQWYIVHLRNKELSLAAQAFLEYIREIEPRIRQRMRDMLPTLDCDLTGG